MRCVKESIFFHSLRLFFLSVFSVLGIFVGLAVALIALSLVAGSFSNNEKMSSKVKLMPDAQGNRQLLGHSAPILLEICIQGQIGLEPLTGKKIGEQLLDSREDGFRNGRVKGVLLTINTPGGEVINTAQIYQLLKTYQERYHVPIYAFVDGLCASGGMYIASIADKIYASETSFIGSVGVLSWPPFVNVTDTMKKVGMDALTVYAGKGKDTMNPFRPWKEDEQKPYQEIMDYLYQNFVDVVIAGRPRLTREELVDKYGASVFPAPLAEQYGFIDASNSSRSDALTALAQAADIPEGERYQVVAFDTNTWVQRLFKESALFNGRVKHELDLSFQEKGQLHYLMP